MFYHSSFEKEYFFYWRAWLYYGKNSRANSSVDFLLFPKDFSASLGRGNTSIKVHISIPLLFSVWFKIGGVLEYGDEKEISIRTHDKAIWWTIWRGSLEGWSRDVPRWREGSFHVDDFILGRSICSTTVLEERNVLVPMPEKSYEATTKLVLYEWKRPRWFTKKIKRVQIDVPEGIPHEGKGENSWDCGIDRTFGITTGECRSIPEGVGILVGSVLKDRVRYGGWGDYKWDRQEEKVESKENKGE